MRSKAWITLSGLEFTPCGGAAPVCWPWRDVRIAKDLGFVPLGSDGQPFKPQGAAHPVVHCSSVPRYLGQRLKARGMRAALRDGARFEFACKSDEIGGAAVCGVFVLVCIVALLADPSGW